MATYHPSTGTWTQQDIPQDEGNQVPVLDLAGLVYTHFHTYSYSYITITKAQYACSVPLYSKYLGTMVHVYLHMIVHTYIQDI